MKAMILAAGLGTRLRPLTDRLPKALMPIVNRPILRHHLDTLRRAGVNEVVVNTHHHAEAIERDLGDGLRFGLRVVYSREERLLGTGGALARVRSVFAHEPRFLLINADLWHRFDLRAAIAHNTTSGAPATLLVQPHPGDDSGWVGSDTRGTLRWVPGMNAYEPRRRWAFTGIHVLTPAALEALPHDAVGCIFRIVYRPLLEAGTPPDLHCPPPQPWWDIGTPAGLLRANLHELRGRPPVIAPSARVEAGAILGPQVAIGAHATVCDHARLRRTIVLPNGCVSSGSAIEDAIVGESGVVIVPREFSESTERAQP